MAGLLCALLAVLPALAASSSELPRGFLIGDSDGVHVTANGEYFIYCTDMQAGDKIHKVLTIQNNEPEGRFRLHMTATPLFATGPIDLLNSIHLTLKLEGKTLYRGRVRGDEGVDMINNALDLGVYASGDVRTMTIDLELDKNLPSERFHAKSVAEVGWNFIAVKDETSTPPKTGDVSEHILEYAAASLALLTLITFGFAHRRKAQNERNQ